MRHLLTICALAAVCLVIASSAWAVNSVVVETKDQLAPNSTVEIRVKLTNDVALNGLTFPFVIRSDSANGIGALTRPVSCEVKWRERLPLGFGAPMTEISIRNEYATTATADGNCKRPPSGGETQPGGFGTICDEDQDSVVSAECIETLPWACLLYRGRIFSSPSLPVGADAEGSILLDFGLNDQVGCFIIDSVCTNPANHLLFIDASQGAHVPEFTVGRVCVGMAACANAGLTAPELFGPEDGGGGTRTAEFTWSKVEWVDGTDVIAASGYTLEVDTSMTFANPLQTESTTGDNDTSAVIILPQGVIDIFWRVRADGNTGTTPPECSSPYSEMRAYTICDNIALDAPEPMTPEQGPLDATFEWGAVSGATSYTFELDYTPNGAFTADFDTTVDQTSVTVLLPSSPPASAAQPTTDGSLAAGAQEDTTVQWRVRANQGGCSGPYSDPLMYTDVKLVSSEVVPGSYALEQNYPNPFNAGTVITFTNARAGDVKVEIYNILGQSVITLVDGFKPVGVYSVDWRGVDRSGSPVPSGMYFYRFSTKDHSEVKKMTLLK